MPPVMIPAEQAKPRPNPLPSAAPDPSEFTPAGALADVKLLVLKEKPRHSWSMTNCGFTDGHVSELCKALQSSECELTELDLSFNKLTDNGLFSLCQFLAEEGLAAHALTSLRLGGSLTSSQGQAVVVELFNQKRPDVTLDFEPTLRESTTLLTVGKVFPDSPASAAGLRRDDSIVAIGTFNFSGRERNRGFKTENERLMDNIEFFRGMDSLKPLVAAKAKSGGEIDVVVQRTEAGVTTFVPLTLRPAKWAGEGLLGAKIGVPEGSK